MKKFENPEMEITVFAVEDVIATSDDATSDMANMPCTEDM